MSESILFDLKHKMSEVHVMRRDMGYNPTTVENLPVRLMSVVTALDAAEEGFVELDEEAYISNLAEVAILLIDILSARYYADRWTPRTVRLRVYLFSSPSDFLSMVRVKLCRSHARWRRTDYKDAFMECELALLHLCEVTNSLDIDLVSAVNERLLVSASMGVRNGGEHEDS